jgi:glycosyltransferase involved in cell wall biosynthesis
MRIGLVLISDNFAGAEKVVYNLAITLSKMKDVKVILFINTELIKFFHLEKVDVVNIGKYNNKNPIQALINFYTLKRKLRKLIDVKNIDVLNAHMETAYMISPFKNLTIVLHGTDIRDFLQPPTLIYRLFSYGKTKSCYQSCRRIISVSKQQITPLPKVYQSKTIVIPNGVDSNVFRPINISRRKNVILFTGRYVERKGLIELIGVVKKLPQYEFWFAGQGPLAHLIRLPNAKNLGFKTTKELVKLYNQANICVFPSHWEALPLCGLEAMACGKALIATPIGFTEYIENNIDGLIIPEKNTEALQEAIVKLMQNDSLRTRLEINARKKALQNDWESIAKQYLKVFEEVITENRSSSSKY